jgi:hypothetical protein
MASSLKKVCLLDCAKTLELIGLRNLGKSSPAASAWDAAGRLVILDHTWNRALLIPNPPP